MTFTKIRIFLITLLFQFIVILTIIHVLKYDIHKTPSQSLLTLCNYLHHKHCNVSTLIQWCKFLGDNPHKEDFDRHIFEFLLFTKAHLNDWKTTDLIVHTLDHLGRNFIIRNKSSFQQASEVLNQKIKYLQNPSNCSADQIAICSVPQECGFGCVMHDLIRCFAKAIASGRRTVYSEVNSQNFLTENFQYLSEKCPENEEEQSRGTFEVKHTNNTNITKDVEYSAMESLRGYMTQVLPPGKDPYAWSDAWYVGQLLRYLLRPLPHLEKLRHVFDKGESPIAGIHVRRTDKTREAPYQEVKTYMGVVEQFFSVMGEVPRRLYIATDEPAVIEKVKKDYAQYEITTAETLGMNIPPKSAFLQDLFALSQVDVLVCTLTSQFCSVAYELRVVEDPIWAFRTTFTLDTDWCVPTITRSCLHFEAMQDNSVRGQLEFKRGDVIESGRKVWKGNGPGTPWYSVLKPTKSGIYDGLVIGTNLRTGQIGKYPRFKVQLVEEYP